MMDESWEAVQRIYNAGITNQNATFQTETPERGAWVQSHRKDCRLIARIENQVAGWAA